MTAVDRLSRTALWRRLVLVARWVHDPDVISHPRYRAWERRHVLVAVRAGSLVLALVLLADSLLLLAEAPQLAVVNGLGVVASLVVLFAVSGRQALRRRPAAGAWLLGTIAIGTTLLPIATIPSVAGLMVAYMPIVIVASALFIPWNAARHVPFLVAVVVVVALFAASPLADLLTTTARGELVSICLSAALVSLGGHAILQRERRHAFLQRLQLRAANDTARHQRLQLEALAAQLEAVARRDPLTGVGNRIRLDEDVAALRQVVDPMTRAAAVILLDIDHFKDYNDANGHLAGDNVLRMVARTIAISLRPGDQVYRYGGEEFVVLLDGVDIEGAMAVAERLRAAIEGLRVANPANRPWAVLTASAGVAEASPGRSPMDEWIAVADTRLYAAKAAGRNCIVGPDGPSRSDQPRSSAA